MDPGGMLHVALTFYCCVLALFRFLTLPYNCHSPPTTLHHSMPKTASFVMNFFVRMHFLLLDGTE